jgi:DNA-binding PadR family transcriptional regulator
VPAAERARTQRLTTTEGAVLALLALEGERSGYDLAKRAEKAIGQVWSPARSGLYATLRRLAADGLVTSRSVEQVERPDKQVYRLGESGREALTAWLERVDGGARDAFFLKLFVGGLTTVDVLLEHVEQFHADVEERLERLRAIEPTNTNRGDDWFHRHMLDYGIRHAELELDWADGVAAALRRGPA